ncbi:MAG TPA: hypothetical protein VHT52_04225 [Stellaceae bacterium]|jgi:hypothetical protein|nr:hypothetical protein [Stellaceae bacterium]
MKTTMFAIMLLTHNGATPQQLAAEPTLAKCQADIRETVAHGLGFYDASSGLYFCKRVTEIIGAPQ